MNKKLKYKLIALLMCTALLISCSLNTADKAEPSEGSSQEVNLDTKTMTNNLVEYEEDDYYSEWKEQSPSYIRLNGEAVSLEGKGATAEGNIITISSAGTYVVSGKLNDGQIIVSADSDDIVRLVLNGAEINCSDNAPIYVENAGKTIISLEESTDNIITDGSDYNLKDSESDEPNAAIFSKDDLTINGNGALTVNANYNNGIFGKDGLKITGGTITIYSVDDGLLGRDLVAVKDANIKITSEGDGIKVTNDTEVGNGNIILESGTYDINAGSDGIQAEKSLSILDGTFNIVSSKDSIHSNGSVSIYNGNFEISSEDDGIHADKTIDISGGTININKSYEGIEGAVINILNGNIRITSQDDGINVAGGADSSSFNGGRQAQGSFSASEEYKLSISGGYIYVDAAGDGIDSNGSVFMDGGTVLVNGPTNNGNGALDYNQSFEISGGLLIASGSSGMVQSLSESSTQNSVMIVFSQMQQPGTIVSIRDDSGNSVVTFAPDKNYQSILVSSPDLTIDTSYQLYTGGAVAGGSSENGYYEGGTYENGTKTADFTLTKSNLSISETGEEVNTGGFRQPGQGGGGMKPQMQDGAQRGEMPEMPEGGNRPQRPDGFQGQQPEMPNGAAPGNTNETTQDAGTEPYGSDGAAVNEGGL